MGVMDRYNNRKKDSSESDTQSFGTQERYALNQLVGITDYEVNQDFINSFFADAKSYIDTAQTDYDNLGWSSASSSYDSRNSSWIDLYGRSYAISKWLDTNRSRLDDETYNSLKTSIDSAVNGVYTVANSFKSAKDFYAQFDTEDSYNKWNEEETAKKELLSSEDFEYYSQLGASVENPSWDDAQPPMEIFGWTPWEGETINNKVTFYEANMLEVGLGELSKLNGGGTDFSTLGWLIHYYMTDEEKSIYNYYIGKGDTAKAEEYLTEVTEVLKQRQAGELYEKLDGTAYELLFSVSAGVDSWISGIKNIDNLIMGTEGDAPSATQYAASMMSANNEGLWKGVNDLAQSVGNMLPSMAIGYLTYGIGGNIAMGVSVAGNAYAEMKNSGYSNGEARAYAGLVAGSEVALQYVLGGISSLGSKKIGLSNTISKYVTKSFGQVDNALVRVAIQVGANMASEAIEEAAQSVLEPIFKSIITGEELDIDWGEVAYSGLLGALTAGLIEGTTTSLGTIARSSYANNTYGNNVQGLVSDSLALDPDNAHAQRMQTRLDKGKNVSGYQINRLLDANTSAMLSNDTTAIKTAVEKRLTELGEKGDVKALAEALTKQAKGERLTSKEKALINSSTYGQRVANELNPDNIQSGEYSSAWAESIGTRAIHPDAYNKDLYELAKEMAGVEEESVSTAKAIDDVGGAEEAQIEVSDNGKTMYYDAETDSYVDADIKRVVSTKGGIEVELENGKTVKASDLRYATREEGIVYEMLSRMDVTPDTANELINTFKPTSAKQARLYYDSIPLAYRMGLMNNERGLKFINLSKEQKQLVYNRGRIDAVTNAKERDSARATSTTKAKAEASKTGKNGIIFEDGVKYDESTANDLQKAGMAGAEAIAKVTNLEVHVFESFMEDGKRVAYVNGKLVSAPNGYFTDGNKIYIDINAGMNAEGAMLYALSHEIAHYIRKWNAQGFKDLADFLIAEYGKQGVNITGLIERQKDKIRKRYQEENRTLPSEAKLFDMAYEELVADAMSDMLADPNAYKKLAKFKKKNFKAWQKLGEVIKNLIDKLKNALGIYRKNSPVAEEALHVRDFTTEAYNQLQALYIKAFVEADNNYNSAENTLAESGIAVNPDTDSASLLSVRDVLNEEQRKKVASALATRFGVTKEEAMDWLKAETSMASLILNPKYSQYLDYTPDPNEVAIKQNSDYPQGTVDFSPICAKRREFTSVMNNILRLFPNHVFAATDLAKIRTIMQEEGMTIPCGICYVEDRRQLDTIVAQNFIDSLKLYREGSKTRPDGKPFNANQLKGLSLIDGDSYTPSVYELVSLEGLNVLKEKNPNMAEAWVKFNNARGMQSVRLLANEAEYKRQILKYTKKTVQAKNDKGGLRVYSFSDAEMFHLIDIIQVITDSATVGLSLQGYTKVNEYAKAVKDTGEKLNRSLIPKGELGYHIEDGKVVLDYDTVEGIDINHPDFFDNRDNPNVGNITIGVSDVQIRAAMVSDFVDQIIPFHTGQSEEVLGEKGIATWTNYKDFQTEKDIATGKVSEHQINIYTEVLQVLEKEGKPINKRTFVEKFLQVCKDNGLTPRFSQFLNTNENGEYVYTEGYHKMLVDFKTFAQTEVGEYLPQMPVKPIFDNEYITKILKDYVESQKVKDAELTESMPKVIERITNEIVKPGETVQPSETKYSDRVLMGSLFSGGGTLEAGLVYQMLDKEFAVEYNKKIASTYTDNHGKEHMFVGDVRDFNSKEKQSVFYLHASPVCKNFSPASHSGGETTLDITTAQATARVLEEQMPQVFTVENVKRYIGSEAYNLITNKLDELGYTWDVAVYKASDYGNATKRERMIIRAVRDGQLPAKPQKASNITSWGEATRDLWKTDLIPSYLVKSKIEAIKNTPELKNLKLTKLDKPLMIYDTTKSKQINYAWADELAPTLTTKCGDARIIMPDGRVYAPTPKFMGRIQGLPDDYKYPKATTNAFKIIGNGIPTQLTKAVMGGVLDSAYEQTHDGQVLYSDRDSSYLDAVKRGDIETAREMVYEAADKALSESKITDKGLNGFGKGTNELVVVYHATPAKFTVFDKAKIGSGNGGANFGKGFYFSAYRSYVQEYDSNIGEYFLDIRKPFVYDTVNKAYIVDMLEKSGYEYDKDFVASVTKDDLWDMDLIDDFLGEALMGKNPYNEFSKMLQNAGFDGIIVGGGDEIIAFDSNQIKSADPVTYDDNGNVIPLSERFKTDNDDIRYSDRDSEGNTLSKEQQEFFKDSKVRDKRGNLMVLYHGTTANFNTFKKGDVGFHFGTKGAARGRVGFGKNVTLKEVYLNITNPIVFDEDLGSWDADFRLTRELYDKGILTQAEAESVLFTDDRQYKRTTEASNKKLASVLLNKGYDGIAYLNTFETKKATTSYIVFNSSQAKEITNKTPTSDPDIRYSLRDVEPVEPTTDKWQRTHTTSEVKAMFPDLWDVSADESEVRNPTQISGTVKSYRKVYDFLKKTGFNGTILDASSGLGYGTRAGIEEYGFDVEDIEPYPDKSYSPKYTDYSTLDKQYDVIISNAVLNVIPQDQRDALVVKMGELLKDGGRMFINVRGDDVKNASSKVAINEDLMEYYISKSGSYQKGFTKSELVAYLQDALGDGFTVTPTTFFGKASAVVTKNEVKYSDRDTEAVSNRTLLANALESVAQNDIEKTKLTQYKEKIALIEAEQKKLSELRAKIKELSFAKGARDTEAINKLQFEANQIANRINTYDKQLLNLESTTALKGVLEREKANLRKRLEQKGKEAIKAQKAKNAETVRELMNRHTESRKKAVEGRHKTEMRHKIQRVVSDLNKLLLNPTKEQHVPIGLQKVVADALDAVNMDTMNAEERVKYYNDLISKSSDPDEIKMLTKKRDFFEYRDMNFKERITALKNAYAEFKDSDDPLIRNAHNDAIADLIKNTADAVGNNSLKDMSYEQLEAVYDMYKAVLATVRNANKMFKEDRQATVTENSEAVKAEVKEVGGHQERILKAGKFFKKFGWDMLKPVTAMKAIGSKTLARLFNNVRKAEDTWAVDVNEAKEFYENIAKKYGYKKWNFKAQHSFKDSRGEEFSISLEQMLSLYAYSKREQADEHLEFGGFIFDDAIEVTDKKLGIPVKYEVNDANPHRLGQIQMMEIIGKLTQEQKAFVDEMQTYLSDVMGAKGNEVSLALYDIKLYKEKNYFPLKTARYFREFDPEKSGTPKIKNSGFSKKTVPQAGNPIVLSNFMDVWASHVNDMSMYHAFVLPLEDFMRVYNYSSTAGGYDSVQQYIKNAYGSQANQYIERLMDDLNGGARVDSSAGVINKGISLFKKASVFASLSVVIQQPSAMARAFAYINPKYFAKSFVSSLRFGKHKEVWAEVKKYAPVAVIKEMGYFDTGMGRSTVEWIKGNKTIKDKMDDVLSKAPAMADELTWSYIWLAVKKEIQDTTNLTPGTEEFLNKAGERFTEIITNTQVYDSVLARSGMMRSKDTGMKMATAFGAEPTTVVNMMIDGVIQGKRGNKKFLASTVGGVSASIILNSMLVALVYAARDDDEDETYTEKYLGSLTSELIDGFNPLTYIPFVKDIWSIAQGYDVERSDMSVVSNLWETIEGLFNEDKSGWDKVADTAGAVSSLFGIPLKNIIRDGKGVYNLFETLASDTPTTGAGISESVGEALTSSIPLWDRLHESDSNSDKLYEAILSGDQAHIDRVKGRFEDEKAIESAMRQGLRDNDSRIQEAAQARYEGDIAEYTRIAKEIIAEGYFSQDIVVGAINAEINAIKRGEKTEEEPTEEKDEVTSIYSGSDVNSAFENGDEALAKEIIADLIETKVANGMEEKNAKSSVRSSMTSYWKPLYKEAYQMGDTEEMARIRRILYSSGLYGTVNDVVKTAQGWLKD